MAVVATTKVVPQWLCAAIAGGVVAVQPVGAVGVALLCGSAAAWARVGAPRPRDAAPTLYGAVRDRDRLMEMPSDRRPTELSDRGPMRDLSSAVYL